MQLPQTVELKGIRVLTTRQLAEAYGTEIKIIQNNFQRNKDRYVAGKHYIYMDRDELREVKTTHPQFDGELKRASRMHFWTEKGALLHAKSLNTDKAWEVYDYLVDFYFRAKEKQPEAEQKKEVVPVKTTTSQFSGIRSAKGMVVDIPENSEAQKLITQARKYLTGMDALLDVYSMYHSEEDFEKAAHALREMQSKISWATSSLCRFQPKLVEKYL